MDTLRNLIEIPFTSPTLIFLVVLCVILLSPLLLNRIRVPHIIGLILAGVIIGPNGLGIVERDMSFELFGKVGLLYLMFLAGLEMDINDFRQNRIKGFTFGFFTFVIPMVLGTAVSYYLLHMSLVTSILLASMYASHTLVAYPIISRYGVAKNRAVTITIAGTIITVILALLILAIITGMYRGELNARFWVRFGISIILYSGILFYVFPRISKWFLRSHEDNVTQYIFVLCVVFAASFGAEIAGLEGIIGAFLAGIVLNRYIPSVSPLMNRIEFVGNALFIPYFLIGVGMLVDLSVLFSGREALIVALSMSVVATISKWLAAWITQKTFRMNDIDRQLIFGLSNGQAAATLAAVLIGYNIIIGVDASGEPIRLLNENILNGTIIMILVTCTISSIVTESAARRLALQPNSVPKNANEGELEERVLIPVANPATIDNLVNLALLLKDSKKRTPLYALSVSVDRGSDTDNANRQDLLPKVEKIASAVDTPVNTISRYDVNIASGIIHTIKENRITDIVVGFHHKANIADALFGPTTQNILRRTNQMMLILKCLTPINSVNKLIVCVPPKAEYETGFVRWVDRIANMATQLGCMVVFYSTSHTERAIDDLISAKHYRFRMRFEELSEWETFVSLKNTVGEHDLLVMIAARHTSISYTNSFAKLPTILAREFCQTNLLVIYPEQFVNRSDTMFFTDPQSIDIEKDYLYLAPNPLKKYFLGSEEKEEGEADNA